MAPARTIFVVDDHESILSSVSSVLTDESHRIQIFGSAEALLEGLKAERPDLILLDIWLPGIDGIEALKSLKERYPEIPVIIMSGHAGIDIAVNAMKAGAADFLEKPLNLDILLEKIARHLPVTSSAAAAKSGHPSAEKAARSGAASIAPSKEPQRTIKKTAVLNGVGLLSGKPTGIIISPMPVDSGITFRTMDGVNIPAHITALEGFGRIAARGPAFTANSTVLAKDHRRIRTVEHLLAALNMMGITNALVKVNEEVPNVDGSAADFCRIIQDAGVEDQAKPRLEVVIHETIGLGDPAVLKEKFLFAEPFDGFEVEMRVHYPAPIHEQKYRFNPSEQAFAKEIAPARSFNTFENIDMAQKQGMVGSGYLNSHIIIHDGKVINTELNFPDEFVRHKILDLLGDLCLLGYGIRGRVVGNMTSHGLNQALAVKIHEAIA
jgi:UDP-3-O-[3-hydroxymyristoyl] N-acetylglucosamine deacetylase